MSDVTISVLNDTGEAILRLTGVALVPPGSTYRIDPVVDDESVEIPEGWPSGELRPCAQRITRDGVDLVIGADVVSAAALRPGTPVTISVPAVGARAELEWPSLEIGVSEPAAGEDETLGVEASELAIRAAVKLANRARVDFARIESELIAVPAPSDAEENERRIIAALVRNLCDDRALSSLTLSPEVPPRHRPIPADAPDEVLATLKPVAELRPPVTRDAPLPMPARPVPPKRVPAQAPVYLEAVPPPPPAPTVRRSLPSVSAVDPSSTHRRAPGSLWPTAAAFALGLALAGGGAIIAPNLLPRFASASAPTPARIEEVQRETSIPARKLADILAIPDSSPRGEAADQVNLEEALRRADQSLSGGALSDPDRREAKFWLRKALAASLGDERLLWAITQLGTLYASSPDGEAADLASARVLWELAAAKGDPVALCFLASLFENGLGVKKDPAEALALYQSAKANGGCRGVDGAIARLTKSAP